MSYNSHVSLTIANKLYDINSIIDKKAEENGEMLKYNESVQKVRWGTLTRSLTAKGASKEEIKVKDILKTHEQTRIQMT